MRTVPISILLLGIAAVAGGVLIEGTTSNREWALGYINPEARFIVSSSIPQTFLTTSLALLGDPTLSREDISSWREGIFTPTRRRRRSQGVGK